MYLSGLIQRKTFDTFLKRKNRNFRFGFSVGDEGFEPIV